METEAVYLYDSSIESLPTTILSCQPITTLNEDVQNLAKNIPIDHFAITTHQTIFYPQGGGQPSDSGLLESSDSSSHQFQVSLVRKTADGQILHFGSFPSNELFKENESIIQKIDSEKRNYHSRLHTAGHIIGLAMRLLTPVLGDRKKIKANHAPKEACMEFEGLLYNEHKPIIEDKINEIVKQNLPVTVSWWKEGDIKSADLEVLEGIQLNKEGLARVVEIGDVDANPCGGTHVPFTGDVGGIVIRKISRKNGVSRLSYEVC